MSFCVYDIPHPFVFFFVFEHFLRFWYSTMLDSSSAFPFRREPAISPRIVIPFIRVWYLETKIWALYVLMAIVVPLFLGPLVKER